MKEKLYQSMQLYKISIAEDEFYYGFKLLEKYFILFVLIIFMAWVGLATIESLFLSLSYIVLRHFSGGIHFSNNIKCLCTSILLFFIFPELFRHFILNFFFLITIYLISYLIVKYTKTADHPNKKINHNEDIYFKNKCNCVIFFFFFLSLFLKLIKKDVIASEITFGIFSCCLERLLCNLHNKIV